MAMYADEVMADAPVGYWKLNETSGTVCADSSGNGYHMTYFNSPRLNAGPIKRTVDDIACYFPGGGGRYAGIAHNAALKPTAASIEMWVTRHDTGDLQSLFSSAQQGGYSVDIQTDSTLACAFWLNGAYRNAAVTLGLNESAHVVFTCDGRYVKSYKNGVLIQTYDAGNVYSIFYQYSNWTMIAANPNTGGTPESALFANATLSHVALYNYALSDSRIAAHYAAAFRSISAEINESLTASSFVASAYRANDGFLVGRKVTGSGVFTMDVDSLDPVYVEVHPVMGETWKKSAGYAMDDLAFPSNPVATPFYYKRLVAGTSGATEPTWPTTPGNKCNDGAVTDAWECVERMVQPITHGPLVPS